MALAIGFCAGISKQSGSEQNIGPFDSGAQYRRIVSAGCFLAFDPTPTWLKNVEFDFAVAECNCRGLLRKNREQDE